MRNERNDNMRIGKEELLVDDFILEDDTNLNAIVSIRVCQCLPLQIGSNDRLCLTLLLELLRI
jgi:hypothetical protein